MHIKLDAMVSLGITYVGIIQTARVSGLKEFHVLYELTKCHNSHCVANGTINEDDHMFSLSAAKKYGGVYVRQIRRLFISLQEKYRQNVTKWCLL